MNQSDGAGAEHDLTMSLVAAAHRVEDKIERALGRHGLSLAKLNILTMLVDSERPLSLGEIATRLACVRSNVTQLVDRLESDGLVRRQADPTDRRSISAVVTDDGRERQRSGSEALSAVQSDVTQALAGFDTAHIDEALRTL